VSITPTTIGAIIVTNSVLNMMSPPSMLNTNTEVNDDLCIIPFLIIELQMTSPISELMSKVLSIKNKLPLLLSLLSHNQSHISVHN
jgi:hypothetical protein